MSTAFRTEGKNVKFPTRDVNRITVHRANFKVEKDGKPGEIIVGNHWEPHLVNGELVLSSATPPGLPLPTITITVPPDSTWLVNGTSQ